MLYISTWMATSLMNWVLLMVSNVCTQPVSYLLIPCAVSVSRCAAVGQCQPNTACVERWLGSYSDLSVALWKESGGGTQLAPPDPIFFTQAFKNNPYILCLAMKDFSVAEYFPCSSQGPAHLPIYLLNQGLLKAWGARRIYPLMSGN